MNVDTPYISQRSIVAYSGLTGTPLAGEWYAAGLRKPFGVSCRTSATLAITAGANISSHIRAVVDGTGIRIECLFDSTGYPSETWGVSGSGTLTVQVTTAGDETQNLAGTTATFSVNVLVLEYDMPYGLPLFRAFRRGESVHFDLAPTLHAFEWQTFSVMADGGSASGGQSICAYVDGSLQASGLILHNDDGEMWISGSAARPGVYRVYFDLESKTQGIGTEDQRYHPFKGDKGENALIIWIYEDYLPGDLVVLFPNPAAGAEGEPLYLAAPFAPAKAGDVGLPLEVPGALPCTVIHSLSNRFAGGGSLAALMDDLAAPTWKRYPLRRLLSLFTVGATVTMHFTVRQTSTVYSEDHNASGEYPEHDDAENYPDGIPGVSDFPNDNATITVSSVEDWTKEETKITESASADVAFSLSFALWDGGGGAPAYLEALLNRAKTYSNSLASYSHDRTASSKNSVKSTTYALETITEEEAIGRGIPFAGDGQGGGTWAIFSGSASVTWKHYQPGETTPDFTENASFVWRNGEFVAIGEDYGIGGLVMLAANVTAAGMVTVSAYNADGTVTATRKGAATASGTIVGKRQQYIPETGEWEDIEANDFEITITAAAKGTQDTPGVADDPHAGRNNGDGTVTVVYSQRETLSGASTATTGGASTATATGDDFEGKGTATVVFGEGRELSWAHRAIVAVGSGEGGIEAVFAAANAQRQVVTETVHGGIRERSGGGAAWIYISGSESTWGTTTTTTTTDTSQPAAVGDTLSHGDTFHTGILALILAAANMGTLSFTRNRTDGSGYGEVYGLRQTPGGEESADIDPVSGGWTRETVTATGAPSGSESSGEELSIGDLDLSGEITPEDWQQWGYSYNRQERQISTGITFNITDSEYSSL